MIDPSVQHGAARAGAFKCRPFKSSTVRSGAFLGGALVIAGAFAAGMTVVTAADTPALKTYHFKIKDLAEPGESKPNAPKMVPKPDDVSLTLPPGFSIALFADGIAKPRVAVEAPNGDIFISDPSGVVFALHDANGNHTIDEGERSEFAKGLKQPFGLAFYKDSLYVADTDAVLRFAYKPGQLAAAGEPTKITDLPNGPTGHWTRNLKFAPDGKSFYVTVGSSSNVDIDPDPLRGTVLKFNPDGSGREVIASGIRNPVGLDFHPQTKEPWVSVQERDGLGDELAPDYVAHAKKGAFFGWPYAYTGGHEDPRHKGARPDLVKTSVAPDVLLQAHSSAMTLAFYTGKSFPEKYRHGAFVALRGSSGRTKRTGYKVVFVPFNKGKATGAYEDFVIGWMLGEDKPEVWGRPVGLAVLKDGSMLVTDDGAGKIWRVSYAN
jgi:glucose/arabinose dehydrogenase